MMHGTRYAYAHKGCRCLECVQFAARLRRRGLPEGDPRHGTLNGWSNYGCRCEECRAANTRAIAMARASRVRAPLPPDDPRHGTYSTYTNYKCRCELCRTASTEYRRRLAAEVQR